MSQKLATELQHEAAAPDSTHALQSQKPNLFLMVKRFFALSLEQ